MTSPTLPTDRPRRIYILCGNASYNRGDRGNLLAQIDLLRKAFPDAELTADSFRPEIDQKWYGIRMLKRGVILSADQVQGLRESDLVIWGGGALLADNACITLVPFWLFVIAFVKIYLRKPVMAWAHGIVLNTRMGKFLASVALRLVDVITVRDANSYAAVLALGIPSNKVHLTADPAITVISSEKERGLAALAMCGASPRSGRKLFAIVPTFWHLYHAERDIVPFFWGARFGFFQKRNEATIAKMIAGLTAVAAHCADRHGADLLILPRYPIEPWRDLEYCDNLATLIRQMIPEVNVQVFKDDTLAPRDYLSMYRSLDFVISIALHDLIFAVAHDVPVFNLHYEPKGIDFANRLGLSAASAPWTTLLANDMQPLLQQIDESIAQWASWQNRVMSAKRDLVHRAKSNVDFARALLEPAKQERQAA